MMSDFKHLAPQAREALSLSKEARIDFVKQDLWIPYEEATTILDDLAGIIRGPRVDRMPCRIFSAPSNAGKTALAKRLRERHSPYQDEKTGEGFLPVLFILILHGPDLLEFYRVLLTALGASYYKSEKMPDLRSRFQSIAREMNLKMLVLDEINAALKGKPGEQELFLNELKAITVNLRVSIVCLGTKSSKNFFLYGADLRNRFIPLNLEPWTKLNEDRKKFLKLLEASLPLPRRSGLSTDEFGKKILAASEGHVGDIKALAVHMAEYAIKNDLEYLPQSLVDKCGWMPPSLRFQGLS